MPIKPQSPPNLLVAWCFHDDFVHPRIEPPHVKPPVPVGQNADKRSSGKRPDVYDNVADRAVRSLHKYSPENLDGLSVETGDLRADNRRTNQQAKQQPRQTALLRPSQRPVESLRYRQRSIMPLLAKRVAAKDLPGHCAGDLRVFVQLISLCMPQLPLPEKLPMLKRSHHDGTQVSVG